MLRRAVVAAAVLTLLTNDGVVVAYGNGIVEKTGERERERERERNRKHYWREKHEMHTHTKGKKMEKVKKM